jgi:hypothetical protein
MFKEPGDDPADRCDPPVCFAMGEVMRTAGSDLAVPGKPRVIGSGFGCVQRQMKGSCARGWQRFRASTSLQADLAA